ncbi:MAG: ComF family protein [Desulfobacterales bacterium]|nr:ComF family protein [Desulfobacterales bacterium]
MNLFSRILNAFTEALFPTRCLICKRFYSINHEHQQISKVIEHLNLSEPLTMMYRKQLFQDLMRPFLCETCLSDETPFRFDRFDQHEKEYNRFLSSVKALVRFDGTIRKLIHCLKYNRKIQIAKPLGLWLFFLWIEQLREERPSDLIIPVPLHRKRMRQRGFNQSYLLIRHWEKYKTQLPQEYSNWHVRKDILERTKYTLQQVGLLKKERMENVKNAFKVTKPEAVYGKSVLLIDDVFTTGATSMACAQALLLSGAICVDVMVLARI